ncbi:MAG: AtzE family amidohydrolase [Pseudomonadota bacterium]
MNPSTLLHASALEQAAAVRNGTVSAEALTAAALERIAECNAALNAFTTIFSDRALVDARSIDKQIARGTNPGPLAGVPFAVKNLFDVAGEVTLAGSRINADNPPATADARVVARLKAAGALCVGATNMGEYAYDFVTANHHYGATLNPHAKDRSAGGSSGGSAAAVAAGFTSLALGTDTNGSIRVPASFCGLWGFKPSYGRLSRSGSFLFVGSLDTIGIFGRHVSDVVLAYGAMHGPDPSDPVCWPDSADETDSLASASTDAETSLSGVRSARLGGYFSQTADELIDAAVDIVAEALGAEPVVELPQPALARTAAFAITAAEGGALHRSRLNRRYDDFDPASRDRLLAGALLPSAWYLQAQRFRRWWQQRIREVFDRVDVLVAPATPVLAPRFADTLLRLGDRDLPLRPNVGLFTQPLTLVGLPVMTAPVQGSSLPTGVQLIGRPGSEALLLRAARFLEERKVCGASLVH